MLPLTVVLLTGAIGSASTPMKFTADDTAISPMDLAGHLHAGSADAADTTQNGTIQEDDPGLDHIHIDDDENEPPQQEVPLPITPIDANAPKPFDATFLEGKPEHRMKLSKIDAGNPPELRVKKWLNTDPLLMQNLKGKIVVLSFWATWCEECLKSIPKNNALAQKYKDKIVLIGICHDRGIDNMEAIAERGGIIYPICSDDGDTTIRTYVVDTYPDYYVFDQKGRLRIADCVNSKLEEAVVKLLAEE